MRFTSVGSTVSLNRAYSPASRSAPSTTAIRILTAVSTYPSPERSASFLFTGWCKQVIGLCLTTFLQAVILVAGLMVVKDHALLGLGLMLSAGEVPRIAGQFGLDTGTRANVMGAVYAAQGAVNLTKTIVQVVK